ncbi:ribonuclease E/G [Puniceibacterium sp. IMCC21224]|uniref:Rne/Rng family ribonuclease n=1 Tax=Puniceibacterium sp. IMCC21224 TaxID=1618204 RepID=UPI00064E0351|nr:ribonuclease E/G [Puniceibacterium sp. IMCC21224]KMK66969.1 RNAse E [Puniceibacterium sp. IMCC21224]
MPKKMLIDATHAEETRVVVVDGNKVEEFDFESENKRQLAGNIYLAKVTRVEPSLQAAFVDYGGNRHGFLAFSEIHTDYYQIPIADRQALMEEEQAYAEAQNRDEDEEKPKARSRSRSRSRSTTKPASTTSDDKTTTQDVAEEITGMETIDLDDDVAADDEGLSPMETVADTPVAEPADNPSQESNAADESASVADESQAEASEGDAASPSADPSARDESIESVADDDTEEDLRPVRKPRPRRYKIQEVIKVRQILLVQVVKEERGNKGAALTTYLSLAGRYCVLMPNTARGGGISRKITNAADRSKLKEIAQSIEVPKGAGLIVRTAGAKRTKTEIKRDYEYLQRLWEQIRELTLKSIAPAKIYEEGDLIKRSIRDLYNRDIDEVFVEGERGYRIAKDFMKMIMPSHAVNVKHYRESMPLFARYQVESYLSSMFNPTVQLKSGGYIVIGVTEALVAIDVNSGRATKEGSIEDTATKTNLEAAEEVARQLRLRDLAGLIVIDFIDMDERKNNLAVEKKIKDKLKTDRARIQVGRISGFGLLEMSRQRLRPGMIEATTAPCPSCHGTGLIRSDDNLALQVLRQIEEEGVRKRSREVLIKCPVGIANYLMNQKREHIAQIELRYGMAVRIEGDPHLVSPDFSMEKFKTATRSVPEVSAHVVSVDTSLMDQIDEDNNYDDDDVPDAELVSEELEAETANETGSVAQDANGDEGKPKKRRRRRRRSRGKSAQEGDDASNADESGSDAPEADQPATADVASEETPAADTGPVEAPTEAVEPVAEPEVKQAEPVAEEEAPKPKPRTRSRSRKKPVAAEDATPDEVTASGEVDDAPAAKPKPKPRTRRSKKAAEPVVEPVAEIAVDATTEQPAITSSEELVRVEADDVQKPEPVAEVSADPIAEAAPEPVPEAASDPVVESEPTTQTKADPEPVMQPTADAAPVVDADAAPEPAAPEPAGATPEPAVAEAEPDRELEAAEVSDEADDTKPKKRGWWSMGR